MTAKKPTIIIAAQDRIDAYEVVGRKFLSEILDHNWDSCLLTDESSLSDFVGSGNPPDELPVTDGSYPAYAKAWGAWILAKINAKYSIEVTDRHIHFVDLFALIEASSSANIRH